MDCKTTGKQECPYCKCDDIIDIKAEALEDSEVVTLNIATKAMHKCGECESEFLIYR
ncbi:MAG: hypothetical protein JJT76_16005 [Clostridiaceae bacterium]|nr:hypothetical protein [Clostridiaceae bacterium]